VFVVSRRPYVCVVDDDESILPALGRLLRAANFEVETFASGETFVETLSSRRPDAVVLDVHMPLLDGFAVRDRMRRVDTTIPVVFITSHEGERVDRRVAEDARSVVVRKPFAADRLIDAIVDSIAEHQLTDSVKVMKEEET